MADLFIELSSDGKTKEKSSDVHKKHKTKTASSDSINGNVVDKESNDKTVNKEGTSTKRKESKDKPSTSSSDNKAISELSDIMQSGFNNLQQLLEGCIAQSQYQDDCVYDDENLDLEEDQEAIAEPDLFQEMSKEMNHDDKLGDEAPSSLAAFADGLLKAKLDSSNNSLQDKYLRPKNIEFLQCPQVNKPIWSNLTMPTKTTDLALQGIQKEFIMSAIPTLKVMQQLNDAKDDLNLLDVKDLLRTLSDSLALLGSANVGMVNKRRSLLKKELPPNMHMLCNDSREFSGSLLFGNSLSNDIKEVSELNKIAYQLRGKSRGYSRGGFRGVTRGGSGRVFKRGGRGFFPRRSLQSAGRNYKNGPLNRGRPSKQ